MLRLTLSRRSGTAETDFIPRRLVIAGWTGRDPATVRAHIDELALLGVAPPARTPLAYRIASRLLTVDDRIEVLGTKTSGEAEFVLLEHQGELWVGVGSDHTCRALETTSVPASKQVCAKPMGRRLWPLREVEDHWDRLELRSYVVQEGRTLLYQSSELRHVLPPAALLALCREERIDFTESAMFCGTVPLQGACTSPQAFVCQLRDPILDRMLECRYAIRVLDETCEPRGATHA